MIVVKQGGQPRYETQMAETECNVLYLIIYIRNCNQVGYMPVLLLNVPCIYYYNNNNNDSVILHNGFPPGSDLWPPME